MEEQGMDHEWYVIENGGRRWKNVKMVRENTGN